MIIDAPAIDRKIIDSITSSSGIQNAESISKATGYKLKLVKHRMKENPAINEAIEVKSIEFVGSCSNELFHGIRKIPCSKNVRDAINKRIDSDILKTIEAIHGVPTSQTLAKTLPYIENTIRTRLSQNPSLNQEADIKGAKFIENCDRETFEIIRKMRVKGRMLEAQNRRIDACIHEAIQALDSPTQHDLTKSPDRLLKYDPKLIISRLSQNPMLRQAFEDRKKELREKRQALRDGPLDHTIKPPRVKNAKPKTKKRIKRAAS